MHGLLWAPKCVSEGGKVGIMVSLLSHIVKSVSHVIALKQFGKDVNSCASNSSVVLWLA